VKVVATNEAKTHLSSLLREVERGETIVISRGRKPLAKLVPYDEAERAPRPKVGEMIDEPCRIPEEALRPMNAEELRAWGAI
jgi:prevent-host-death family protein